MKRCIVFILTLICVLGLGGCNNRTMDYIIENEQILPELWKKFKTILL